MTPPTFYALFLPTFLMAGPAVFMQIAILGQTLLMERFLKIID